MSEDQDYATLDDFDRLHDEGNESNSNDHRERFRLARFDDLRPGREAPQLIKGILPKVGLAVVWGAPKCGKSFWTFDLVMHAALGWTYRGRRVRQGDVVYLALEGASGFRARIEAYRRHNHPPPGVPFSLIADAVDLVADHRALIAAVDKQSERAPAVVVIDTLNRSMRGSESSDEDMAAFIRAADRIRDVFGCLVIVVHHSGHDTLRPRGHSSLIGAVDALIAVKRDAAGIITAEVERLKDGAEGAVITSRLEVVDVGVDEDGDTISSCVIVEADTDAKELKRPAVTGQTKIALDALQLAIDEAGEIPPISGRQIRTRKAVRSDTWRRYCAQLQITEADNPEAKGKAFRRAWEKLQEREIIGVWSDWVWIND